MSSTLLDGLDFTRLMSNDAGTVFNEAFEADGKPRAHWRRLLEELRRLPQTEFVRRSSQASQILHDNGVTYNVFGGEEKSRPWTLDLLPATLARGQWNWLREAVAQRGRVMQMILRDIYGPQELLKTGLLPPEVVFAQSKYERAFTGFHTGDRSTLSLFATELARSPDGMWRVMADRTDAPVGLGFALENRIVTARLLPQVMHRLDVERMAPFFLRLKQALASLTPTGNPQPRIVLFSPGPNGRSYFEDVYLARYLGYTLVEGGDLAVRDDRVYLKTLSGLQPVDVILCRTVEGMIDPLEQGDVARGGVPGLLQAIRQGNVQFANKPGCGLLESPVFMAFLPQLCRHFLGEDLKLNSIATWWCGDPDSWQTVQSRFADLVIKPAFEESGGSEYIVADMADEEIAALKQRVSASPGQYVAQERIERSSVPCWRDQKLTTGHIALRTYAVIDENNSYDLMPGGLVRIAPTSEPMELSILAGVSSKDLWIPAEEKTPSVSLLQPEGKPVELKRSEPLFPSRVADNLFWYGQSLEQTDFLARLLRATVERLTSESEDDLPELKGLLQALADQGQIDVSLLDDINAETLDEQLVHAVFNGRLSQGIANTISELQRLNTTVRDWISPDLWWTTQHTVEGFLSAVTDTDDLAEILTMLDRLLLRIAAVSGQIHDGMIRGPAWRFLDIGRRIDRATNSANLLVSAINAEQLHDRSMLKAILEILDCSMTYRSRYLDNIQTNGVLDLAITDETNPHSIGFQAALLSEHLEALPQDRHPLRSPEKRTLMRVVHAVRMMLDKQLEGTAPVRLRQTLEQISTHLKELGQQLTRKYLVHSVQPQQMHD